MKAHSVLSRRAFLTTTQDLQIIRYSGLTGLSKTPKESTRRKSAASARVWLDTFSKTCSRQQHGERRDSRETENDHDTTGANAGHVACEG